jgi:ketosteroid isomerase-like protein
MTETGRNKAFIRSFLDAMRRGDAAAIVAAYAEDGYCESFGHTLISGRYSRDSIAAASAGLFAAFPDGLHFEVLNITAEEDRVAVEATSLGKHVSGKTYANHYHFLFHLRDGRIAVMKEFMDTEHATDVLCGGQRPTTGPVVRAGPAA